MFGVTRARNAFGRRLLELRSRRPYVRAWADGPLLVVPGVLDPVATKVGAWLASVVAAEAAPGESWLDMGCGSGVVGLALAARGARVTCADVDPRCVDLARANAELRGLVVEGVVTDHFAGLPGRRFDGVAYNVPFWPGEPGGGPFDRSFYAGEGFRVIRAFAAQARDASDRVLVAFSQAGADHAGAVEALGPSVEVRRERHRGEWLVLRRLAPLPAAAPRPSGPRL